MAKTYKGKSMKLGGGGRFAKLEDKLAKRPGVTNPGALAAKIGRDTYGEAKMARMSKEGKQRANPPHKPKTSAFA